MGQPVDDRVHDRRPVLGLLGGHDAVVAYDQVERPGDPVGQLGRLQAHQSSVLAQFDEVAVDLLGDAQDHLGSLDHTDDVPHRHRVLELEDRQVPECDVEPAPEPLHGGERLVGPVVEPSGGLDGVLDVVAVHGDDRHGRRHRQDGDVDRPGHAFRRPVSGAGLGRRDRRIRHQVHIGSGDPGGVGGEDDGAVHLGQLRQPLRAELGVEQEPARADREDGRDRRR